MIKSRGATFSLCCLARVRLVRVCLVGLPGTPHAALARPTGLPAQPLKHRHPPAAALQAVAEQHFPKLDNPAGMPLDVESTSGETHTLRWR